jgi:hypothetical protein
MSTTTELNPTTAQPIATVPSDPGAAPLIASPAGVFTEEGFKEGTVAPKEQTVVEQQQRANANDAQRQRETSTISKSKCCTVL